MLAYLQVIVPQTQVATYRWDDFEIHEQIIGQHLVLHFTTQGSFMLHVKLFGAKLNTLIAPFAKNG